MRAAPSGGAASVDAVVFDMDGVLVDSGAHHRAAWRAMLGEIGIEPTPDFWRLTIGRPAEEAVPLVLGSRVSPDEAWRLAYRKRQHYVRFARRGVQAVAGVTGFVARLARAGVPCAVATSASSTDVYDLLSELGIAGQFRAIVTADDVRFGKPDPEVYVRAARAVAVAPARCLAFEDSVVGVQAARAAGMAVIGVTTAYGDAELCSAGATTTIATFEGLPWPL